MPRGRGEEIENRRGPRTELWGTPMERGRREKEVGNRKGSRTDPWGSPKERLRGEKEVEKRRDPEDRTLGVA